MKHPRAVGEGWDFIFMKTIGGLEVPCGLLQLGPLLKLSSVGIKRAIEW